MAQSGTFFPTGEQLGKVNRFNYLGSCVSAGGLISA